MSGDRTRITTTNDAVQARVAVLTGAVTWYAYLRADNALYVQRELNGTRDPEVKVVDNVSWLDVMVDPSGTSAWILFMHDTVMARIQVTNLATDPMALTSYTRRDHWYEPLGISGGGVRLSLRLNGVEVLVP